MGPVDPPLLRVDFSCALLSDRHSGVAPGPLALVSCERGKPIDRTVGSTDIVSLALRGVRE